jgi:methionine-rich copper-binding protein CopC
VLKHVPPRVSLRFDETVSTPFGAVRLLDRAATWLRLDA